MSFQIIQRQLLAIGLSFAAANGAVAQDTASCPDSPAVLVQSCENDITVQLRVLPEEVDHDSRHSLTVAGTYSSGDRFGIEGMVIRDGKIISHRYQNWDGVLVIGQDGVPKLFHAGDVSLAGESFDLKQKSSRDAFVTKAVDLGVTVLQSHLLILNGALDLEDLEGAPEFKRRLLVTFANGDFGVWETAQAETLYTAALQVQADIGPQMALNLDMGAYDYCRSGPKGDQQDCGRLLVQADKLTNLLEFKAR